MSERGNVFRPETDDDQNMSRRKATRLILGGLAAIGAGAFISEEISKSKREGREIDSKTRKEETPEELDIEEKVEGINFSEPGLRESFVKSLRGHRSEFRGVLITEINEGGVVNSKEEVEEKMHKFDIMLAETLEKYRGETLDGDHIGAILFDVQAIKNNIKSGS